MFLYRQPWTRHGGAAWSLLRRTWSTSALSSGTSSPCPSRCVVSPTGSSTSRAPSAGHFTRNNAAVAGEQYTCTTRGAAQHRRHRKPGRARQRPQRKRRRKESWQTPARHLRPIASREASAPQRRLVCLNHRAKAHHAHHGSLKASGSAHSVRARTLKTKKQKASARFALRPGTRFSSPHCIPARPPASAS